MKASISRLGWFAFGAILGSVMTYFLDPENRPALAAPETTEREVDEIIPTEATDYEATEIVGDRVLINRVRKAFAAEIRQPKNLHVSANQGEVTLYGNLDRDELETLVTLVEDVPGVQRVINNLKIQDVASASPEGSEEELRH